MKKVEVRSQTTCRTEAEGESKPIEIPKVGIEQEKATPRNNASSALDTEIDTYVMKKDVGGTSNTPSKKRVVASKSEVAVGIIATETRDSKGYGSHGAIATCAMARNDFKDMGARVLENIVGFIVFPLADLASLTALDA